jgi:hypothetical protein
MDFTTQQLTGGARFTPGVKLGELFARLTPPTVAPRR